MESDHNIIRSFFPPLLLDKVMEESTITDFPKNIELLKEGQYIQFVPIVLSGLVKVYSRFDDKELLLYYMEPSQTCVMTFYAAIKNTPSKVFALTEEPSRVLLIPARHIPHWLKAFPDFNTLFYQQFNTRYSELLDTIGHLLLDKMDKRLYDHLKKKSALIGNGPIKMSHHQLANELGTAREVVTRVLKKLETDGKVKQIRSGIKIIGEW